MSDDRVKSRADHLLPEEREAGSDDPEAQAAAILAESDEREHAPDAAPDTTLERRTSEQAAS
jgi:hypothetical protein